MNSLERIVAAVNLAPVDRVPVIAQVFGHAARLVDMPLRRYLTSGADLAAAQLAALERYGYDAVFALMDVGVETEAAGSVLNYYDEQYPDVAVYALTTVDDLPKLSVPDPRRAGRMPELLQAIGLLRREVGNQVAVVGCVLGPMTLATQLLGAETALYLAVDDHEGFEQLLDFATEAVSRFGVAQVEAGAHLPIVFEPSGSPAMVPPQFFRELVAPRLTRLFSALKQAGALCNWLHIAGPAAPILPLYPGLGVDIANFDYEVDPLSAQKALPHTCLDGNLKSLSFVVNSPAEIERQSRELLDRFASRRGFILSSGCEIPPEARPENVAAMVAAVHQQG
ncbi:MAG: uroporphyrinogen decarboxylase family protein [Deltaproteobacteria bacterium]|nr:uroporphyrinogen decarboxylase family protein [Deltaproteobacteria bacterium]